MRSTYRSRCKRKGSRKTVSCMKHRTTKPTVAALTATRFKVVASQLPYGVQRFTLVAIDKAGHRQALPTTKTVTTKSRRRSVAERDARRGPAAACCRADNACLRDRSAKLTTQIWL